MKTTKEKIAVMQAFEDGKPIEFRDPARKDSLWIKTLNPSWSWADTHYRVATEPKLRQWKPEEVPVGALVKTNDTGSRWVLAGVNYTGLVLIAGDENNFHDTKHLLDHYTHSTDGGKTWQPCGVLE